MTNKILHFDEDDEVNALINAVIEESYDDLELEDILDILNDSRTLRELGIYCGSNAILVNARRFIQNKINEELTSNSVLQESIAENVNIWKELGKNHVLVLDFNDNSVTRLTENDLISFYVDICSDWAACSYGLGQCRSYGLGQRFSARELTHNFQVSSFSF